MGKISCFTATDLYKQFHLFESAAEADENKIS